MLLRGREHNLVGDQEGCGKALRSLTARRDLFLAARVCMHLGPTRYRYVLPWLPTGIYEHRVRFQAFVSSH